MIYIIPLIVIILSMSIAFFVTTSVDLTTSYRTYDKVVGYLGLLTFGVFLYFILVIRISLAFKGI